jgi:ribosome assembly protein YihI (activator of Der GTPase)
MDHIDMGYEDQRWIEVVLDRVLVLLSKLRVLLVHDLMSPV